MTIPAGRTVADPVGSGDGDAERRRRRLAVDVHLAVGQFPGATAGQVLRHAITYARAAEAAGFDAVWVAEHHFTTYGVCPSSLILASHVLAVTATVGVGAAAAILSDRHPVALGEETVMLDELSGGRFHLGVTPGDPWADRDVFGPAGRRGRDDFGESLDVLRRWLSGDAEVGADGDRYRFRPVAVVPRPGRPVPIHVNATSTDVVEAAAQRGLPILTGLHATAAHIRNLIGRHAETAARHGHDASDLDHAATRVAFTADTDTAARDLLRSRYRDGWNREPHPAPR
jgi:alkanesulfonate monooxygenase SsuD/methylene tetrahydromethanopterin reductase-like flavin-dependent oxidoreductase (luciferase family)